MIKVTNLTKYFGEKLAVSNLNFELKRGEVVGVLGLNGSGKTTTLRMLTGYLIPSDGEVLVDGISNFRNPIEAKKRIGYLPETPPIYEDMDVEEFLEYVGRVKSIPSSQLSQEIQRVTSRTNLGEVLHTYIGNLSLGFRKRVGIAQAILGNPPVVVMDEPISGLDPKQILDMRKLIKGLSGEHTVVISSHILSELQKTCDRFLIIHEGKLVFDYSFDKLEQELQKWASLEVSFKGKEKPEIEKYLMGLSEKVEIQESFGDSKWSQFVVKSDNEEILRNKLLDTFRSQGLELLSLNKKEITLEQIFLRNI
jgi:ABC-2 type transport system ATP-binding protein